MKNFLIYFSVFLPSILFFGQNIKLKNDNINYKYDVYSEIQGFDEHKFYHVKISDFNGNNYSYSEGLDERAKSADILYQNGVIYGKKWNYLKYELLFEIKLTASVPNKNEVISHADEATKTTKYAYKISSNHKYNVRVFDVTDNNQLIKEFTVDYSPETAWPNYPSATVGFASTKLLEDNYKNSQQTVEGFFKGIDSKLIANSFHKTIVPEIKMLISDSDKKMTFFSTKVKTKDTKFDKLDSATIYIDFGMEEIKKNEKAGIKGNHHVQNAKNYFLKAHKIYSEYNSNDFLGLFSDAELKDEYYWGMKSNLYLANFLIGDYTKTNEIYNEILEKVNAENEAKKNNPENIKSLLKRSSAEKALDSMKDFRKMELREARLSEVFKTRFAY